MIGRPKQSEVAPYYFTYIDKAEGDDPIALMERQLPAALELFAGITEKTSIHRYAPDKWTIRQVLNHVTDTERAFAFRALWFARGFKAPLPGYDQNVGAQGADANHVLWLDHVEEFRLVRLSTICLFKNLPPHAWSMTGVADDKPFTVRALAYIIPGHLAHHIAILNERYF
ncbi:MAG TPA: DinB family protein [Candidatus Acidoferrum sp.]|nr:DinB family protein [Candidatus Acidoferrum sp.]